MAETHGDPLQLALARAAAKFAPDQWHVLPPGHRTRTIYDELRRLDATAEALRATGHRSALRLFRND
jgi:hypothetical protein